VLNLLITNSSSAASLLPFSSCCEYKPSWVLMNPIGSRVKKQKKHNEHTSPFPRAELYPVHRKRKTLQTGKPSGVTRLRMPQEWHVLNEIQFGIIAMRRSKRATATALIEVPWAQRGSSFTRVRRPWHGVKNLHQTLVC
jgi:hypothetical protein